MAITPWPDEWDFAATAKKRNATVTRSIAKYNPGQIAFIPDRRSRGGK
jgi:hypothetical protein